MKKIFLTLGIALSAITFLPAQSGSGDVLETNNGTPILPHEGSVALGIDATPFLTYIGGIFSDADATAPAFTYAAFYGKYFLSDKTALRGKVRLGYDLQSVSTLVPKTGSTTDEKVTDVEKTSNTNIGLAFGLEKRIGETRLQGFYGAELGVGLRTANDKSYTYGNALSSANTGTRTLSLSNGLTFGVAVNLFAGAEYFIAPGFAIGGELGWGIGFDSSGNGERKTETWDNSAVTTKTDKTGTSSSSFAFDNFNGALTLSFYF
ncbi:MAG: hypothetical protein LBF90_07080 [Prevotellaceae bacterium]|jgi:hypothetical protein|nr:hypothetical protein [Prevotellaceae bacterium]